MNYDGEVMEVSLPLRERGLKYRLLWICPNDLAVAPFTGAWIEMRSQSPGRSSDARRSLYGSVD